MMDIARQSDENRTALFKLTAVEAKLNEAIIEKDFWVCWMLEVLFHHSSFSNALAFKGGTSLSKGYGIIKRFSEDIDLVLDWRILGNGVKEPWANRSNTQQDRFNREANMKTAVFLNEVLMPHLNNLVSALGISKYRFYIEENDNQTIRFVYPQLFVDEALVQEIRLEIGSLAAWTPVTERMIKPIAAEYSPHVFKNSGTLVRTVEAKRTFWEKATILHSEAHRSGSRIPLRYSRHYYDMYLLYQSEIKNKAFSDLELLDKVAEFKTKFYRSNRARYDLAKKETLQLLPPESSLDDIEKDYQGMRSMLYEEPIPLEEIYSGLQAMVDELRKLPQTL